MLRGLLLTAGIAAATGGAGLSTAAAAAAPAGAGKLMDTGIRASATDGARYAAWVDTRGVVHVVDVRGAAGSYTTPLPQVCGGAIALTAVAGSGQLVINCRLADTRGRTTPNWRLDLGARSWHELSAAAWPKRDWDGSLYPLPTAVGARWLQLADGGEGPALVNLESGAVRYPVGAATDVIDLDAAEPLQPLCAPLERSLPERWNSAPPFMPASFDGETLVAENGRGMGTLTVQRCGELAPTELSGAAYDAQVGSGIVSWSASGRSPSSEFPRAYLPSCRARLDWPTVSKFEDIWTVDHTADALWVPITDNREERATLRRFPLPAACVALPKARVTPAGGGARTLPAVRWSAPSWGGATAERLPLPGATTPRVGRAGRALTVRTTRRASGLTWQVAGGRRALRARAVGSGGRTWRFTPPRRARGKTLTVTARGVVPGDGTARFAFALRR